MTTSVPDRNAVGWFELYVADLSRAKAFYQAVLQRPMEDLTAPPGSDLQMCAFTMNPEGGGSAGALVKSPYGKPGIGGTLVYFSCADCAVEAGRAATHGGTIFQPKTSIGPYGFIAVVQDTEGNSIGLHSMT